ITDVLMPIMDGFELARKIRVEPGLTKLPILFYSATYHQNQAQWLTEACGVTGRLEKPADPEIILQAIERTLRTPVSGLRADPYQLAQDHVRVLSDKVSRKVAQLTEKQQELETEIRRREHLETALRASEARYRTMIERLPLGAFRWNIAKARFETVNPALADILGCSNPDDLLGIDVEGEVFRDPAEARAIAQMLMVGDGRTQEVVWKRRDGREVLVRLCCAHFKDESCIEGTAEDIGRQRELERQLRQTNKLEALGRLAGGVAHDFNNLLMAVSGYTEVLLEDLSLEGEQRNYVIEIKKTAKRAAGVVKQLLAFSRKQELELRILDLNEIVAATGSMLRHLLGSGIQLKIQTAVRQAWVKIDQSQMEQILLNLAVNARDAMPIGGVLRFELSHVDLRDDARLAGGSYVCLKAEDTGKGIEPFVLDKLFEPFFTTKGEKGSGLGLATVYGIVKQSGGDIRVESKVGTGTTFTVFLPVAHGASAKAEETLPPVVDRGHEMILLVEDEEAIRSTTHKYLAMKGYTVIDAADGAQGLKILKERHNEIAMVVSDITMPQVTGIDLARVVQQIAPRIPVLLISGFLDAAMRERLRQLPLPTTYIEKPFSFATLAERVRESLDRNGEPPATTGSDALRRTF
ncbi:MAG TPA: response regulator, partial [Candidatus Angelobacter sp.]|nr:response regulator [Candidatus Angelobacter sp.]